MPDTLQDTVTPSLPRPPGREAPESTAVSASEQGRLRADPSLSNCPLRDGNAPVWALGLMSGTSMDGIDAALILTDGRRVLETGPALTIPYSLEMRKRLRDILGLRPGRNTVGVRAVEHDLTLLHAQAVQTLTRQAGLTPAVVGFHGHTVLHAPEERLTVQIGDGAALAAALGLPVVNDFRHDDVAAGGQGAPLVPVFHQALAHDLEQPVAVLNLGGVGNVTWLGDGEPPVAFDTGPGNALIDDWVFQTTGKPMDEDGALAAAGKVDQAVLRTLIDHPYFQRPAPKSLDRDAFSLDPVRGLSVEDGAATLAAFTAHSAAMARAMMPDAPRRWLVCGGGRHNARIMAELARATNAPVDPVESVGWDGDALEAQAFGFLAVRSARGLPLTFPGTTGVAAPMKGGLYWPAAMASGGVIARVR